MATGVETTIKNIFRPRTCSLPLAGGGHQKKRAAPPENTAAASSPFFFFPLPLYLE
jgi:hypothetical protein